MKKFFLIALIGSLLAGCKEQPVVFTPAVDISTLDEIIEEGNFEGAKTLIAAYRKTELSKEDIYELNFAEDKMQRILAEFNQTDTTVIPYIKKYLPKVTDSQLDKWRKSGALECKTINGERRYFNKAARNLFRIVPECVEAFEKVEGKPQGTTGQFLKEYLPKVISHATPYIAKVEPVTMRVTVKMKVMPEALPAGENVRIWLPYLKDKDVYSNVKLESVYPSDYIITPASYARRSIYFEMPSNGRDTLKAGYTLTFTSYNRYFKELEYQVKPYDTSSLIYKKYTSQRRRHVVFTDKIKALTDSIIGDETRPYEKVKKIWCWINDHITWAGARDYSTIPNIPMYVLKNGHGDCGQFSLLFITMARYAGVAAKWQSGWMLHPGNLNLHDWAEVYYEGVGWVPVDQSFGYAGGDTDKSDTGQKEDIKFFFSKGLDAYRYIVNDDYGDFAPLYPAKIYPHSDEVDFQMGEVEWRAGNILNGAHGWKCWMDIEYL